MTINGVKELLKSFDDIQTKQVGYFSTVAKDFKPTEKYYIPIGVWQEKPRTENCVMQVVVQSKPYSSVISVKGGVESYFTTKENALKLEASTNWVNRDSLTVEVAVKVADNGAARIAKVNIQEN